jgi:hypothetical protein
MGFGRQLCTLKILKQLLGFLWNNQDLTYSSLRDPRREAIDLLHRTRPLVWKTYTVKKPRPMCSLNPGTALQRSFAFFGLSAPIVSPQPSVCQEIPAAGAVSRDRDVGFYIIFSSNW